VVGLRRASILNRHGQA